MWKLPKINLASIKEAFSDYFKPGLKDEKVFKNIEHNQSIYYTFRKFGISEEKLVLDTPRYIKCITKKNNNKFTLLIEYKLTSAGIPYIIQTDYRGQHKYFYIKYYEDLKSYVHSKRVDKI